MPKIQAPHPHPGKPQERYGISDKSLRDSSREAALPLLALSSEPPKARDPALRSVPDKSRSERRKGGGLPSGIQIGSNRSVQANLIDLPVLLVQTTAMGPRTLHIRQRMPGTNELLGNALTNRGQYAREKRKWQTVVQLYAREQNFGPIEGPAHFEFEFLEPNRRRDPDNLSLGAIKVLLDALCHAKILKDDGWDEVSSFTCTWKVSKDPGVRVTVR